ncbi:hypothetical protein BDF21DRAFT_436294 [Thamnidium elegans]|nr:hypothetical protein BDF21DRAFT_436294 [Thamnidium elegans]
MNLPDCYKNYKVTNIQEGSRHFFADYDSDLNWITQLQETPICIKEYVTSSLKQKKPTKAELMSTIARKAAKKRKIAVTINGTMNVDTFNSIIGDKVHYINTENSSKRKFEAEERKDEDDNENKEPSIWKDWLNFLEHHKSAFHPYSPEANNIIRAGNGISSKPYLDRNLYNRHLEGNNVQSFTIPDVFQQHIDSVVNCNALSQFKKNIREFSMFIGSLVQEKEEGMKLLEFLEGIFIELHETYTSPIDRDQNEDAFNQLFIWPYLAVVAKNITMHNCKAGFQSGQPRLESMSKQLKANDIFVDDKSCYKTDGLVKIFGLKKLELLVVETSGHFGNIDRVKLKFDHHKGVFGMLAMLKCIADEFYLASIEKFSEVKVFFLNGADEKLHLWSISFKEEGIFDLWREATLNIKPEYDDVDEFLPQLVQFFWIIKGLLEQSVVNMACLKEEHQNVLKKNRHNLEKLPKLNNIVNPIILKLTKNEDSNGMSSLGPIYFPPHY